MTLFFKKMIVTTDKSTPEILSLFGKTLLLPDCPTVDRRVAFHTDLSLCKIGKTLVCAPFLAGLLTRECPGYRIVPGKEPSSPYPGEIRYNAAVVGKTVFCKVKNTEEKILEEAERSGFRVIDVKQGYAKCSVIPVSENAMITSDPSIRNAAGKEGFDVLFVSNEGVFLDGFPNGFLGGTAVTTDNEILFAGSLSASPHQNEIVRFAEAHGKNVKDTSGTVLYDIGSPVFL